MTYQRGRQQFPPRGAGPSPGRGTTQQPPQLPKDYLKNGYFDGEGNILPQVVIEWPRQIASHLYNSGMAVAQLRNFFGEARHIEGQLNANQDFAALRGRILQLDAFAARAQTRGTAPPLFKQFIEQNIKWAAKDKKSFLKGFIPHFECVVAYFPQK